MKAGSLKAGAHLTKAGTLKAGAPLKAGALKASVEGRRAEGRCASDHGDDNQTGLYGTLDGGRQ